MQVLTVVGNRPQFVKAAAVTPHLRRVATEVLVHSGQHYDDDLSAVFFDELDLPQPDHYLGIGGGTNTDQTARMLTALAQIMVDDRPDAVLVYGDTNTTLAAAIASAQARIPLVHVEAGMRSYDRSMPEELNRVLVDHCADVLLCSSEQSAENLRDENVKAVIEVVGDVMVDIAQMVAPKARKRTAVFTDLGLKAKEFLLVTAHRAGNVDDEVRLSRFVDLLLGLDEPVLFSVHPRTHARLQEAALLERLQESASIHLTSPLGYSDFMAALVNARAVLTDSGGVQKEAYLAGVPCVTLRSTTEWTETVDCGWNTLVDLNSAAAKQALIQPLPPERPEIYGDGNAGKRVAQAVVALETTGAENPLVGLI